MATISRPKAIIKDNASNTVIGNTPFHGDEPTTLEEHIYCLNIIA
jgi:hypothetical protein